MHIIDSVTAVFGKTRLECTLLLVLPDWFVVKQCLANLQNDKDLEVWLIEKGPEAADTVKILCIAMQSYT